jgi:serine/threonine protein kinase
MARRAGVALQSAETMTPERWRVVTELFHATLDREPHLRASFLGEACQTDGSLRAEVDRLLAAHEQAELLGDPFGVAPSRLGPGTSLGPYQIEGLIDTGGMGEVYEARDLRLGRTVAIKILPADVARDPHQRERFRREARAISSLTHPHICTLYDVGQQDDIEFLVMERLSGETLAHRLSRGALSVDELITIAVQVADGLDEAHRHGLIHRDIKPSNIFLTTRGDAKILDFGLAKFAASAAAGISVGGTKSTTLTGRGDAIGTVTYMSPEQVRGKEPDARSDLFSFGVVLYEMTTGQPPFRGETSGLIFDAILNQTPVRPSRVNANLPSRLEDIITKALEKDPNLRYQRASQMRPGLQRVKSEIESRRTASGVVHVAQKAARRVGQHPGMTTGAAVLVAGLTITSTWFLTRPAHTLTDKDSVLLADFSNSTGDPVFDGALRQGLAVQLEQSPFVSLVSEQRVQETLRLMGQTPDARLSPEISRDLCQRTASAAVLEGSIGRLGSRYVLGLRAANCRSGDILAEVQAVADSKEQVLTALGEAAVTLRTKLGETLSSVEKYQTPLQQATTSSLEALKAFSQGWSVRYRSVDPFGAIPYYQRAVTLDPSFAWAYGALGVAYGQVGEESLRVENLRRAYELRDRVSEREKLYIESRYHHFATGNLEKARRAYSLLVQTYPQDLSHDNLREVYTELGQYHNAMAEARELFRVDPRNPSAYVNLAQCDLFLNRLDDLRRTADEALAKHFDSVDLRILMYLEAFLRGDAAAMARQIAWSTDRPDAEPYFLGLQADTAAYSGHSRDARMLFRRAAASAERAELKEAAAGYEATAALREALVGYSAEARDHATKALRPRAVGINADAALALALSGDTTRAERVADDLARRFPEDTILHAENLPLIRAGLALNRNNLSKALDELQTAAAYELAWEGPTLYAAYLRGQTYLAARQGAAAAAEFQKILDFRHLTVNNLIGPLAHLGLARAYALDDRAKARSAYEKFFTLWKDADPDIPVLRQAKTEYEKLKTN